MPVLPEFTDDTDHIYERLADQLDALPNGFPRTESGIEIRLLKRMAEPEEAWLAGQLGQAMELAADIAVRVGLPTKETTERLNNLLRRGLLRTDKQDGVRRYRLMPFLVGIYEARLDEMDHDMAHLMEQYMMLQGAKGILGPRPAVHRVVPAHHAVKRESILPYEDIRALLMKANSFYARDCICRVEQDVIGGRICDFPLGNCLQFSVVEDAYGTDGMSREEALALIDEAENLGMVHAVSNNKENVGYVCNCCGCCCTILRGITEWGIDFSVASASYYADVDHDGCSACEMCVGRCQVDAIGIDGTSAVVDHSRCIGCGLCVTGCLDDAVHLHARVAAECAPPPDTFAEWEEERLKNRGLGIID